MTDKNKDSTEPKENPQNEETELISTVKKKDNLCLMKKGDYTVHVLIEEIKNLSPKNPDVLPTPIIKITTLNQSKRTAKLSTPCTDYTFNEHIYIEKIDLTTEMLDSEKLVIEVFDYGSKKRSDYFGIYEFDLQYIYSSPNHCLNNLWIGLANPEAEDISKVNGYLKLSASVLNNNDERVELYPQPGENSQFFVPSQIKVTYEQIYIHVFRSEGIPMESGIFNSNDNKYIECSYMGVKKTTDEREINKNGVVTWNQTICFGATQPAVSQKIVFYLKNKNKIIKDITIGSFEIQISDIINDKYRNIQYVDVYGSVLDKSSKICQMMNTNAEIGSKWKGRIYLKIDHESCQSPIVGVRPIQNIELISQLETLQPQGKWILAAKLFEASYLPADKTKYSVKICLQENVANFPSKESLDKNIVWNTTTNLKCFTMTDSLDELPDIFFYLLNKSEDIICFQRIPAKEFYLNKEVMVIKFYPEPCVNKVNKMWQSGLIKIKLTLYNENKDSGKVDLKDFTEEENSGGISEGIRNVIGLSPGITQTVNDNLPSYVVVANVYMSRYLIAGDSDGTSDPYAVLRIYDNEEKTSVKYDCVNGIWNETLIFDNVRMDINKKSTWPIMLLKVMDEDVTSDDMLGYTYLWLSDMSYEINSTKKIKPTWQQLYLERSNKPQGQILISFYIFDQDHRTNVYDLDIKPETVLYTVEINALGLRDLKPLSFIPVKKPYITFDLNSINVTGNKDESLPSIKTQPKDTGDHPNINSVIKFDVMLPKDEVFIPEMQCEVNDYILGGLSKQSLGIFLLSIKSLIKQTKKQIEEDLERANEIKIKSKMTMDETSSDLLANTTRKSERDQLNTETNFINEGEKETLNNRSKTLKTPLIKPSDINSSGSGLIEMSRIEQNENTFTCTTVEDLSILFRGEINNDLILKNKNNSEFFVIKPSFKKYVLPGKKKDSKKAIEYIIQDESQRPVENLYFPLGYSCHKKDGESSHNKMHYRRIYGKELEEIPELGLGSPFTKCQLIREKFTDTRNGIDIFEEIKNINAKIVKRYDADDNQDLISKEGTDYDNYAETEKENLKNMAISFETKNFGTFKGLIRIAEKKKMAQYLNFIETLKKENRGEIPKEYTSLIKFDQISKSILTHNQVVIRIYILELLNLAKKDIGSESDPYVVIKKGKTVVVDEKKNYQDNQKNCKWYKYYDITTELPGDNTITVQIFDYDPVFSDELIGETIIDIEDRYFDHKWNEMINKPIETRKLYHPDFKEKQGEVLMFLEIFEKNSRHFLNPWNISPQPDLNMEIRLIVWETENMENMDVEDTSDIYVTAFIESSDKKSTDIHFRCQDGNASFNYRILLPVNTSNDKTKIYFQVYDNDILSRDDFICGGSLDVRKIVRDVANLDIPVALTRDYQNSLRPEERFPDIEFLSNSDDEEGNKFWIQMKKGEKNGGRVLCSLEVVPEWKKKETPVGEGREEPNTSPYLPPPVGRFSFTMNPIKLVNQIIGPKMRKKFYKSLCIIILCIYLICVLPYMLYHLSAEIFNPFNYLKKRK